MIDRIKTRLGSEEGFTLIELLVVIIILGILVAIAVPSYLSFRSKATTAAAESNVRSAIPAAESYYQVGSTYASMAGTALRSQAPGVSPNVKATSLNAGAGYCIEDSEDSGTTTYYYMGGDPGTVTGNVAQISLGTCTSVDGGTAAS